MSKTPAAAALLILVASAAATTWAEDAVRAALEPEPSILVPVSRYGDAVTYDTWWEGGIVVGDGPWWPGSSGPTYRFVDDAPTVVRDGAGRAHETVGILSWSGLDDETPAEHAQWISSKEYVGLDSREAVRLEERRNFRLDMGRVPTPAGLPRVMHDYRVAWVFLAPSMGASDSEYWTLPSHRLQGLELRVGDDLVPLLGAIEPRWGDTIHVRAWVDRWEDALGVPAVVVRYEQDERYEYGDGGRWIQSIREETWISAASAYPLRSEHAYEGWQEWDGRGVDWREREHTRQTLAGYTPGGALVAWGEAPEPIPPGTAPGLRWGSGAYPASGGAWPHGLSIEQALAAAHNDPTLVGFSLWRAQNPEYRLVGYTWWPEERAADSRVVAAPGLGPTWRLMFAAPGGSTMFTLSVSAGPAGTVRASEAAAPRELTPEQRFAASDVPPRMLTLASVARLHPLVMPPGEEPPKINFVGWGYWSLPSAAQDPATRLRSLFMGTVDEPTAGPVWPLQGQRAGVQVDLENGTIRNGAHAVFSAEPARAVPAALSGDALAAPAQPPRRDGPDVALGLAVGASAAGLYLLLYFLPALKHAAWSLY
ncbi:MAG TPA: hypothetical protein VM582_07100, partial [Candidatus Thermoplasmatota archaeon]|nr:hypothetical protein [Candidatus Thermoplasmatota archaeon]